MATARVQAEPTGEKRRSVPARFGGVLLRTPRYLVLATNVARDTRLSKLQRAAAGLSLGYALWPLDLVPGIIPVAGQLDELAVLIGGLRVALRTLPPRIARDHLERAGLTTRVMDEDLKIVGATAVWVGKKAAALLGRGASAAVGYGVRRVTDRMRRGDWGGNQQRGEKIPKMKGSSDVAGPRE